MAGDAGGALGTGVSRRSVLGGAGKVAAAGVALGAAGAVVAPELAAANASGGIAVSPKGTTAIEFLAQIQQNGDGMVAFGYLTEVAGLSAADLFTGTPGEGTAMLTAYATGTVGTRTANGAVHNLDLSGVLTIYSLPGGGASFGNPDSFKAGTPVAAVHADDPGRARRHRAEHRCADADRRPAPDVGLVARWGQGQVRAEREQAAPAGHGLRHQGQQRSAATGRHADRRREPGHRLIRSATARS